MIDMSENNASSVNDNTTTQETAQNEYLNAVSAKYPLCAKVFGEKVSGFDIFDLSQLETVIEVCKDSNGTLSTAGRRLFSESRKHKSTVNDSDRLKKYLSRFGTDIRQINKLFSTTAN